MKIRGMLWVCKVGLGLIQPFKRLNACACMSAIEGFIKMNDWTKFNIVGNERVISDLLQQGDLSLQRG